MTFEYTLGQVLVKATDISLKFGEKLILRPTSIEVKDIIRPDVVQGQVIGILGPSGIGKTQFSRILTGLQEPTTGEVQVSDLKVNPSLTKVTPGRVGMVAQNYPLFRHRTIRTNLMIALEKSDLPKDARERKVEDYLKLFDLKDKADLYPIQLSGGQRQRVAIIQELLCSSTFLVMDEPFTGLDPLMKDKVCATINKVANINEYITIFVVAHDIEALVTISDCLWLFGRDRDADGNPIPGATIKATYNLIERGLAWRPDLSMTREFADFRNEIKDQFKNL